jgi:HD-GYP domain-containing protein (c-di-GMP phosphodiesterase class II)
MTIKTNILTIFLGLVGIVALSLLLSQYYFSKKVAIESTTKTFGIISKNIREHLRKDHEEIENILYAKSRYRDILAPITFDPFHPALESMIQILQIKNNLHAVYVAHPDGNFYEVVNMRHRKPLYKVFQAPVSTEWTVVTIIDNRQQNAFLDKAFKLIGKKVFPKTYDPRNRPWYKEAVASGPKRVIDTAPYFFSHTHQRGVTYAIALEGNGTVLALDYTMGQLNQLLGLQRPGSHTEVFLADENGRKFASSAFEKQEGLRKEPAEHETAGLHTALVQALLAKKTDRILTFEEEGRHYFAIFNALDRHTYLGIRVDADVLLLPYRENLRYSLLIALFLLLLALPVIFLSTNSIVRPIKALILENNKIRERKFSEVKPIDTYVIEFEALSDSLVSMSRSIQAYQASQEKLLDAMIKLVAEAIDAKSPYTGKHCERVPEIAQMLLGEASRVEEGPLGTFSLTSEEGLKAFEIAAWLHDCGKVSIPEYVVDKSTKLETIYNRIHEIRMRFEVLWRDLQIACLENRISEEEMKREQEKLREEFAFIAEANIGGECMDEEKQARIRRIAQREWQRYFDNRLGLSIMEKGRYGSGEAVLPVREKLLDDKKEHLIAREHFDYEAYAAQGFKLDVPEYLYNYGEIYNLCIAKGTLTPEERYKINEHVIIGIKMLEKIPFPSEMSKIPEYAGSHHETLIGTGYPRKLTASELSIPARIIAIADIFEALTASDRPYKKAKTLSEAIGIMHQMAQERHIDKALFELFLRSGIYEVYARKHLRPEQIDEVKADKYL